jgi:hypothetical protein
MLSDQFKAWFARPFDPDGSVINWALFVLLILVLFGIWTKMLGYMTRALPAV